MGRANGATPTLSGLCYPDVVRASELKHPVQGGSSDGDFRGLVFVTTRSKGIADHSFVSTDCCLDLGSKIVAARLLPGHPTVLDDLLQVSVPAVSERSWR